MGGWCFEAGCGVCQRFVVNLEPETAQEWHRQDEDPSAQAYGLDFATLAGKVHGTGAHPSEIGGSRNGEAEYLLGFLWREQAVRLPVANT